MVYRSFEVIEIGQAEELIEIGGRSSIEVSGELPTEPTCPLYADDFDEHTPDIAVTCTIAS